MRNIQLAGKIEGETRRERKGDEVEERKKRENVESKNRKDGGTNRGHGEEGIRYSKMWLGIPLTCINELLLYQTDR